MVLEWVEERVGGEEMKTAWLRTLVVKEGRGAGGGGEIKEGFFNGETRAFVNANGRNPDRGGGVERW